MGAVSGRAWAQDKGDTTASAEKNKIAHLNFTPAALSDTQASSLNRVITVNLQEVPLEKALQVIARKGQVNLFYSSEMLSGESVTVRLRAGTVGEALATALEGTDHQLFKSSDGRRLVIGKRWSLGGSDQSDVQTGVITGTVVDSSSREGLPGVNVLIEDTQEGAATDVQGRYTITGVEAGTHTLVASYIGYSDQVVEGVDVSAGDTTTVNFVMQRETAGLEEVVVVGYGTQQAENVTGSVGQISSTTIEEQPVADLSDALQGAAANLTIQKPSGAPGAGYNINIRGVSTMNNNDPLVVVDGIPGGDLSTLNPNNIEDISVLKDAGSAAIYGSRAANGVVLVTTKSGEKGSDPTVTFSSQTGMNVPNIRYDQVSGYRNAILRNQALVNSGGSPIYTPEEIRTFKEEGDVEPFMNTIFQNALQQEYNLALSGGSEHTSFRASGRLFQQESNFVGDYGVERYNFRINVNTDYQRFTVDSRLSFQRNNQTSHAASTPFLIADARRTPPYYNYALKDDSTGKYLLNDILTEFNPLGELQKGGSNESTNDTFTGVLKVGYDVSESLQARASLSTVINSDESIFRRKEVPYYSSPTASSPSNISGTERNTNNDNYNSLLFNPQFVLDYTDAFGGKHNVSGLIGVSNESFTSESNGIHLLYTDPDLGVPVSETEFSESSYISLETKTQTSLYSLFGRGKYSYDDKYFAEFNFRYDGSSKFAEGDRWGFFPSVSLAWNLSDESFMEGYSENVGDLKLRASYGTLGNQSVSNFQYQTSYFSFQNAYSFNNQAVSGAGFEFGNEALQWEESTTINFGVDATFFEQRLQASIDVYQKNTTDILLTPTVPGTYGGGVTDYNAGAMRNRGWEASLNYNTMNEGLNHSVELNLSDSWNEVTDFLGREQITESGQMRRIIREGLAFNSYYGYKVDGFFQNQQEVEEGPTPIGVQVQPGDVRYKDKDGDGDIDDDDRYVLGNGFPRLTFGLRYGLDWRNSTWGNFSLSTFIQGVGKRTMILRGETVEPFHANYSYVMYEHQTDYWTPTNPDARWPRLAAPGSASNSNNYQRPSDLYAFDASYVSLKNVRIGYTLPESLSLGAERINVYVNAQNVYTLSHMDFLNPESTEFNNDMATGGSNSGRSYPDLTYYGFGVRLTL